MMFDASWLILTLMHSLSLSLSQITCHLLSWYMVVCQLSQLLYNKIITCIFMTSLLLHNMCIQNIVLIPTGNVCYNGWFAFSLFS